MAVVSLVSLLIAMLTIAPVAAAGTTTSSLSPGTDRNTAGGPLAGPVTLGPQAAQWYKFDYHYDIYDKDHDPTDATVELKMDVPGCATFQVTTRNRLDFPFDKDGNWVGPIGNGTPEVAHNPNAEPPTKPGAPDDNLVSYEDDPEGRVTPTFAHIRKTNPRDHFGPDHRVADVRRIIRRGIPYGLPFDPAAGAGHGPDAERGLVFVAYISDLSFQFEFLQQAWINNPQFPPPEQPGKDPVIGQDSDVTLKLGTAPEGKQLHFTQFVRTEGTIYAFTPAISTLRDLAQRS